MPNETAQMEGKGKVIMNWSADYKARKAVSDCGEYEITWDSSRSGTWYNARFRGAHIAAGFSRDDVKSQCEQHAECLRRERSVLRETSTQQSAATT